MSKTLHGWLAALALLPASIAPVHAAPEPKTPVEQSADALLVGIPVVAFGLTFLLTHDAEVDALGFNFTHMTGSPRHDLALALMRTGVVTYGLKSSIEERRPDGSGNDSFPSGHTAVTFAGAEFIRKEYGWRWGIPAYLAAGFVGWSRVETQDHWWHDVAAGGTIGILSNYDLGTMPTRWGSLSFQPALLRAPVLSDFDAQSGEVPGVAPGVRFDFRF